MSVRYFNNVDMSTHLKSGQLAFIVFFKNMHGKTR